MVPTGIIPEDTKTIHLTDKLHILQESQYRETLEKIGRLHHQTLAAE
jgi:hypothetical protein